MSSTGDTARPRVLVTGTGGPSGVCIMKALANQPWDIYSADIDRYAAGLYLVDSEHRSIVPRGDAETFVPEIIEICDRERIEVLIPTVDSELLPLAMARTELAERGVTLVLASEQTLRDCLDKWTLHARCVGALRVPDTVLVDADFDPGVCALPVIVKPRSGSGSRGVHRVDELEELGRLPRDGTLLVQEYLPGIEYSLDVLARADGAIVAVVPRSRLKVDSGIAVTGRTVHDESLQRIGALVAQRVGLTSVANVQVKLTSDGEPALLEVNPRFPGTMSLTVASGINMPQLCVEEALGIEMPSGLLPFAEIAMVRFLEEHFMDFSEIEALQTEAAPVHA
jgi:carbamoyl-phosphate synthase large subunit